ncbi:hypothetical protein [Nostoc sp.]|uniref:hypothetical protein n=1 Tax=Nostoc sp. TaxID=1180 RepID=UPI002FF5CB27
MNIRLIFFSGFITALIGSVIGLGAAQLGQRDFNHLRYEGKSYQNLYRNYALMGAGLGFVAGVGQACVRELKVQRDREES